MTGVLEWLLDLDRIRVGRDAPLALKWNPPFEAYQLFVACLVLAAAVLLICKSESAKRWQQVVLGILRAGLLALVLALLCRPVLVLQRERIEPSRVALLVDVSQSMARREVYRDADLARALAAGAELGDTDDLRRHSRLELAVGALTADQAAPLRAILKNNHLNILVFADRLRPWATLTDPSDLPGLVASLDALQPDGAATDLPGALIETIHRYGDGRLAAIVLASDAQSNVPGNISAALSAAKARQVPIIALRIGSPNPPRNVAVGPVLAEDNVFRDDLAAIRCRITTSGLDQPIGIHVRLFDERLGLMIDTRRIQLGGPQPQGQVEFRVKPSRMGVIAYRVEADPIPGEDDTDDNVDRVEIHVVSEKLRLLYVDSRPRLEYRYLKNALLREDTLESSCLLLGADPDFAQEGSYPIRRFPTSRQELFRYDVVLFGDVDPTGDWLSGAQARLLVDFVGQHGGGFGLIAGEQFAPQRFAGTPLAKLIPVRIDPDFGGRYTSTLTSSFLPRMTVEGRQARCFRFDRDPQVSEQLFESLPGLYWLARTLGPKPGAEVLLEHPTLQTSSGRMPVMVLGRYGAGKTFFSASDDTWQWRRHTGEYLYDVYVVQLARMLMRSAGTGQDRRLRLSTNRKSYAYGDKVEVHLQVGDPDLLASLGPQISLVLADARGAPVARVSAERLSEMSSTYEAWFVPPKAGSYTLRCEQIAPRAGDQPASTALRVEPADLESRHPEADHPMLARIAAETGGALVDADELTAVLGNISERSVRIPDDISEPLWDSKLALILFAGLITAEWILRKSFGMI